MSHFTVLVIGPNPEGQLAPFQENNMGDCPKEYLEFRDVEDEYLQEYESKKREMWQSPSGERYSPWDDKFKQRDESSPFKGTKSVMPDDYIKVEVPYKEIYPTFEAFVKDWHGSERNPEKGRYGYWENPNAKWDWYQMGGRWAGIFKLKPGVTVAARGEQSWMQKMSGTSYPEGSADQAYKGDIDFEAMRDEEGKIAGEKWDKANEIIAGREVKSWEEFDKTNIDEARKAYHNQPVKVDLDKAELLEWSTDPKSFLVSREKYIQKSRNSAVSTFAVIKDGKWYENGKMGWWGIVTDEKEEDRWCEEFTKLLDETSDETLLTVFDCHI